MKTKELVIVEIKFKINGSYRCETITVGEYNDFESAVKAANMALLVIKQQKITIKDEDVFMATHPNKRMISNTFYPTNGITFYAKIMKLEFSDLFDVLHKSLKEIEASKKAPVQL